MALTPEMEAKTRQFLASRGLAWPTAPQPELLLDESLRECSRALGRIVVQPDYFRTVAHIKSIDDSEPRKLGNLVKQVKIVAGTFRRGICAEGTVCNRYYLFPYTVERTRDPGDFDVLHTRLIVERPRADAVRFLVQWQTAFRHEWPSVDMDYTIHPWLATAQEAQRELTGNWIAPGGWVLYNWWNDVVAKLVVDNYPNGADLIAPIQAAMTWSTPDPTAGDKHAWWAEHRRALEAFVPPTALALSCALGRSALTREWTLGKVGSVALVPSELTDRFLDVVTSTRIGVVGCMIAETRKCDDADGFTYTLVVGNQPMPPGLLRLIVNRAPDKEFLVNWRRAHGKHWPQPFNALPDIAMLALLEYNRFQAMCFATHGANPVRRLDQFAAAEKDELAEFGVRRGDLDGINARGARRKARPESEPPAAAAPQDAVAPQAVAPQAVESDRSLEKEIEEQNRELARLKREQKGLIPALVPPPAPQVPRPAVEEPVAVGGSKAHKKRSKKGQQQAKAAARALEKEQEETRVFLKETAPGFREVDGVTGEPSQQHAERVATEAMRAQVKGDRKKAKELQREDREERTAEVFGL